MKKLIAFFSIFIVFSGLIFSYELTLVSEFESNYLAQNWIIYLNKIPLKNKLGEYKIRFIEPVIHKENLLCEIYHLYPRGHILIPSYKEFPPIKSFSVVSDFDPTSQGYEYAVLEELKAAFDFLYSYKQGESQNLEREIVRNSNQWNEFTRMDLEGTHLEELEITSKKGEVDGRKLILRDKLGVVLEATTKPPLLDTRWGQSEPYWNDCPMIGSDRCVVGCVATAMAQIMRYYKYPKNGQGSHSYYWGNGSRYLSADFSDSYDWDYMPNTGVDYDTSREEDAVAELCYEAGVSVEMMYGTDASGAYTYDVASALKNHFKYSEDVKVVYREDYGNVDNWFQVLKAQRDQSRPLEFAMYGSSGGHAVVIDGYLISNDLKKVHINMGWDGWYDAYYTLDDIGEGSAFDFTDTYWQHAVIDIVPIPQTFALTIAAGNGGTTNPSPGTHNYNVGTQVSIRAIPNSGYRFLNWTGDASGATNPIIITMNGDKTIQANFIRVYKLTLSAGTGGTTDPAPGSHNYDTGSVVQITAIPDTYYGFKGWSGAVSGRANPITATMNSDKSITATFIKINPPSNFAGEKVHNYSFTQDEYIITLAWEANPDNESIVKYKLYLVEGGQWSLLSEFNTDTFKYWHRDVEKDKQYTYALIAVNDRNREGEPAYVHIDD